MTSLKKNRKCLLPLVLIISCTVTVLVIIGLSATVKVDVVWLHAIKTSTDISQNLPGIIMIKIYFLT